MEKTSKRKRLTGSKNAMDLLDLYYLEMRCHLLETAAALDRIHSAPGAAEAEADPRMTRILESLPLLKEPGADKAKRFLEHFSISE
jgi:hypothetical protein